MAAASPSSNLPNYIESNIDGEFEGWSGETLFKLQNGLIFQQSLYNYTYSYSYMPKVFLRKIGSNLYQMKVEGIDSIINVKPVTEYLESRINGDFEGWTGETIFELDNGQVWKQASYAYNYY